MVENNNQLRYLYHLYTWGGFYNECYTKIHGEIEGPKYFDSADKRQEYINHLRVIENELQANHLVMVKSEGYHCDVITTLHRVIEWEGKRYYSSYNFGWGNYPFEVAKYHIEYKWYPGFNDYPLGEEFEHYEDVKVIQEWITGAFSDLNEN